MIREVQVREETVAPCGCKCSLVDAPDDQLMAFWQQCAAHDAQSDASSRIPGGKYLVTIWQALDGVQSLVAWSRG